LIDRLQQGRDFRFEGLDQLGIRNLRPWGVCERERARYMFCGWSQA